MSDVTQVEVEPQKTAFISRPYSREEKLKQEEEELQELIDEQKQDASPEEEVEEEPTNAEEKTFKKRYSDLRRHQQKQTDELKAEINNLKIQLEQSTKKQMQLPKSDEDIESWAKEYPDVAAIVETIAIKKANEQQASLEERVKALDDMQQSVSKQRAETELLQMHPDFDEIRNDDDFHAWAEEQPQWVQNALYENDNDARSAARAIDLYKADKNITAKKPSSKDAAKSVSTKGKRNKPTSDDSGNSYKESDVQRMSAKEYEKHSDDIMEAIRNGKFIYDVSGSAR
jgi:DNA repair exonuclease SbcCD ATPase subunit